MTRIRSAALVVVACTGLATAAVRGSEFTDSGGAAIPVLQAHFEGKPGAIVVGLVDGEGSDIITAGGMDDGTGRPVDGDSVFFIGSVSKTFTALLLVEMAARDEVKLDDPVAKYLPDSVSVPTHGGKPITLFHLATNTSGLPFNPGNMIGAGDREQYESFSVERMYAFLGQCELSRDPGAEYQYSNLGMALLGHALSRAADESYETLVVERICRPLGMTSTCVTPTAELKTRLAMGRDENGKSTGPWQLDALVPAGSIHSTANDLLKFVAAQAGITRSALTPLMEQTHVLRFEDQRGMPENPSPLFGRTGMAWMEGKDVQPAGMQLLGHAGGAGSYHAWVGFDKKQHRGVVVLTTANDLYAHAVGGTLLQRLPLTAERLSSPVQNLIGIGTALAIAPGSGALEITKVLPETPAQDAGLTAGLVIFSIDGRATAGLELAKCVELLRGPEGAKVRLEVFDPDKQETRTVELTRRKFRT